jgi:hypothetical protein
MEGFCMLPYFIFLILLSSEFLKSSSLEDSERSRPAPLRLVPSAQPADAGASDVRSVRSQQELFTPPPLLPNITVSEDDDANSHRPQRDSLVTSPASRSSKDTQAKTLGALVSCLSLAVRRHTRCLEHSRRASSQRSLSAASSEFGNPDSDIDDKNDFSQDCDQALKQATQELSKSLQRPKLSEENESKRTALAAYSFPLDEKKDARTSMPAQGQ